MPLKLVEAGVYLPIVDGTRTFPDGLEKQRLWIKLGVHAKYIKDDSGCWLFITTTDDQTVTDDEKKFPLIVVVESGERVDGTS